MLMIDPFDIVSGRAIITDKGMFYLKDALLDLHKSGYPLSNSLFHREGGPAAVFFDGTIKWYINGKLHRDGGPAVTHKDGSEEWWSNGNRHNTLGPAILYKNGRTEWWLSGREYTKKDFNKKVVCKKK